MCMPFRTTLRLVCPGCRGAARRWNAGQQECSCCGRMFTGTMPPMTSSLEALT